MADRCSGLNKSLNADLDLRKAIEAGILTRQHRKYIMYQLLKVGKTEAYLPLQLASGSGSEENASLAWPHWKRGCDRRWTICTVVTSFIGIQALCLAVVRLLICMHAILEISSRTTCSLTKAAM